MSKPGYVIVEGNGLDALRGHVNQAIQNGYRPIGGPFKICGAEYGGHMQWGQAMVLEGCKP